MEKIIDKPFSIFSEESAAQRIYGVHIGVLALIEDSPFGSGGNSFTKRSKYFHNKYELKQYYHMHNYAYFSPVTAMGRYFVENGLVFFILLLILISHCKFTLYNITLRSIIILFLAGSLSIAFPPIWILLAITEHRKRYNVFKYWNKSLIKIPAT